MILQIYDQLLFEVYPIEKYIVKNIVKKAMEKPIDIYGRQVSFKVDLSIGNSFGEMEKMK